MKPLDVRVYTDRGSVRMTARCAFATVAGTLLLLMNGVCAVALSMTWTTTGSMSTPREQETATTLQSGQVLVTGGQDGATVLASTEIYNPATGVWSSAAPMSVARTGHTATLLNTGGVLVVGSGSAEVYDPSANVWRATGVLAYDPSSGFTATLLGGGKVLVAGGSAGLGTAQAELYDPATNAWAFTGSLGHLRFDHVATRLNNGKVLVAGGYTFNFLGRETSAEIYDPVAGTWSSAGSTYAPTYATETALPGGGALLAGGEICAGTSCSSSQITGEGEVYDPVRNAWSSTTTAMSIGRSRYAAVLLGDGTVLVDGGFTAVGPVRVIAAAKASAEIYHPAATLPADAWTPAVPMSSERAQHANALLPGGRVIAVGGSDGSGNDQGSAEYYTP